MILQWTKAELTSPLRRASHSSLYRRSVVGASRGAPLGGAPLGAPLGPLGTLGAPPQHSRAAREQRRRQQEESEAKIQLVKQRLMVEQVREHQGLGCTICQESILWGEEVLRVPGSQQQREAGAPGLQQQQQQHQQQQQQQPRPLAPQSAFPSPKKWQQTPQKDGWTLNLGPALLKKQLLQEQPRAAASPVQQQQQQQKKYQQQRVKQQQRKQQKRKPQRQHQGQQQQQQQRRQQQQQQQQQQQHGKQQQQRLLLHFLNSQVPIHVCCSSKLPLMG
ncbi:hypothetical protein, conserved [Eimeria tenella]|uniref:Uncharacterized protein n=1 Tax=Eimeria tenella TaxID=5802 RepID=U6KZB5_EIMTE|nr:hypothetical protein, conserved [Eimeria tenella]CDJ41669.1 hypothetical protein, conserved [Eimeria tenella]|eukprot:XP_013232419.1 hypothetical protein, conserved [Eimeria tenella]